MMTILEAHARHESSQQAQTPGKAYRHLLPIVYRRLAEEWGVSVTWDECLVYGGCVQHWPVFADSVEALAYPETAFQTGDSIQRGQPELRCQQ